jgi:hypothetical protein
MKGLHSVFGLQDTITVRLEKVVEELHVELIVLDHQDGFAFIGPRWIQPIYHFVISQGQHFEFAVLLLFDSSPTSNNILRPTGPLAPHETAVFHS